MSNSNNRGDDDNFQARPTTRMGKNHQIQADGDTWQEMMAVCEAETLGEEGNIAIRSYYQNMRTGQRVWDEPPSGATRIMAASDEMRRMAQLQLQEMHLVVKDKKDKKKGFMKKVFGTGKKKKSSEEKLKIQYKPGSQMYAQRAKQDTEEALLQEAIAASLAAETSGGPGMEEAIAASLATADKPPSGLTKEEEEQLEMAKALSMSEAARESEAQQQTQENEDEMLARILEQSKMETKAKRNMDDLLGMNNGPVPNFSTEGPVPNFSSSGSGRFPEMMNQKMPARKSGLEIVCTDTAGLLPPAPMQAPIPDPYAHFPASPTSPSNNSVSPVAMFDPYARGSYATSAAAAKPPPQPQPEESSLQKMEGQPSQRQFFKRKSSVKKMQDKAGLV